MEKPPIVFKTEHSLFLMLKDGSKRFDFRKWDMEDDRIYRMSWGKYQGNGERSQAFPMVSTMGHWGLPWWSPFEPAVSFMDKATGELLTFRYLGLDFPRSTPGWCVILLGEVVK